MPTLWNHLLCYEVCVTSILLFVLLLVTADKLKTTTELEELRHLFPGQPQATA